jgi:hypothetical protein
MPRVEIPVLPESSNRGVESSQPLKCYLLELKINYKLFLIILKINKARFCNIAVYINSKDKNSIELDLDVNIGLIKRRFK